MTIKSCYNPAMPKLIDSFGRHIEYLRLSVTDRCDLRCFYCIPKGFKDFQEPEEWLTFLEIERVIASFGRLGVHRIRITGGEPLVRKNMSQLAARLSRLPGIDDLSLSTNAVQLARHAKALKTANIQRLNVSLDSLDAHRFKEITNGGKLDKVIDGLMAAKKVGFHPIKINMVLMKGINEHEVENMVQFCIKNGFTLRFIETMPMGSTGQNAVDRYLDLSKIKEQLAQKYQLISSTMPGGGPARYVHVAGTDLKIGFITPLSQHFCETCNRVRLSADGTLHLCLGQSDQIDLRSLIRMGADDKELESEIIQAISRKPERHEFNENPQQIVRFMSHTGG